MKTKTTSAEHSGNNNKNDVLKLVHRGGKVEIFTTPIPAAEVMKLNPRHCVARPDVFKFPWVVVHPKTILKPGNVFYIVPNHTIRKLLQKQGYDLNNHPPDLQLVKSSTSPSRSRVKATYESDSSVKKHRPGGHSSRSARQSKVAAYDTSNHDHDRNTNGKCESSHHADESSLKFVHSNWILEMTRNKLASKVDQRNEGKYLIRPRNCTESYHRLLRAETDSDSRQSGKKLSIKGFETDCSSDSERKHSSVCNKAKSVTGIRSNKPQVPTCSGAESDAKPDSKKVLEPCLITDPTRKRHSSCNVTIILPSGEIIKRTVAQPRGRNHPY